MRMWMVDPRIMCRKHLMGEHVELHMLVGSLNKQKSVAGFVAKGLIETASIHNRHKTLVAEMERRGYNHKSPLPSFAPVELGNVDTDKSLQDLTSRCETCRGRYEKHQKPFAT